MIWEPASVKTPNVVFYVRINGPTWLYRGDRPQMVTGIPGIGCIPNKAGKIAIASSQEMELCVPCLRDLHSAMEETGCSEQLLRRAWSPCGYYKISKGGSPSHGVITTR